MTADRELGDPGGPGGRLGGGAGPARTTGAGQGAPPPEPPGADAPEVVHLPAPTAWPMVLALGLALGVSGLVTHASVTAVGVALALSAAVGWWRDVLPVERTEAVPLRAPGERAAPIAPSPAGVEAIRLGDWPHRAHVPVHVQPLSAGVVGGLLGGVAMAAVALGYGLVAQGSLWYPVNLLSAVAMPDMARASLAELRAFSGPALAVGIVAHGLISVLAGLLYAAILPTLPGRHMLWGGVVAPLLWTGFLWAVLGVIDPALDARVDWRWFIASQVAFGLATGFAVSRAQPIRTMQTWPLAARAGLQATGTRPGEDRPR